MTGNVYSPSWRRNHNFYSISRSLRGFLLDAPWDLHISKIGVHMAVDETSIVVCPALVILQCCLAWHPQVGSKCSLDCLCCLCSWFCIEWVCLLCDRFFCCYWNNTLAEKHDSGSEWSWENDWDSTFQSNILECRSSWSHIMPHYNVT